MEKTTLNIAQIDSNTRVSKAGVTSLFLYNYGDSEMKVIYDGVVFIVPPFDKANEHARSFTIGFDSTYSDVEFDVEFENERGKAILMFKALINQPKNC